MEEKNFSANAQKVYGEIVDEIINNMESGKLNWEKTWDGKVGLALCPVPCNANGEPYKNMLNRLVCTMILQERGSTDPRFFGPGYIKSEAKKQSEINKNLNPEDKKPIMAIKAGAKSYPIVGYFKYDKDKDGNEIPEEEQRVFSKVVRVFHADDIVMRHFEYDRDGKPLLVDKLDKDGKPVLDKFGNHEKRIKYTDEPLPSFISKARPYTHEEQYELAEEILVNSKAVIKYDQANQAFYVPSADEIHLPPKGAFPELGGFYSTALHELAHWTGHESRLDRNIKNSFGSPDYAKEELRAELASTFMSLDTGLPMNLLNHAAYTQTWLKILKDDKMEFMRAVFDAYKITDTMKEFASNKELLLSEKKEKTMTEAKDENKPAITIEDAKNNPYCYKYYAKPGRLSPGGIPAENMITIDPNDRDGAVYYSKPLTKEQLAEYELTRDKFHRSNNLEAVVIYKQASGTEFTGKTLMEINLNGEPLEFSSNYKEAFSKNFMKNTFDLEGLNDWLTKKDGAPSIATGDIVQVNDQLYFLDGDSFKEIKLEVLGDEKYVVPQEDAAVMAKYKLAIESYGTKYDMYAQQYRYEIVNGNYQDKGYGKFLRDNAFNYGLSTLSPGNEKGWHECDKDYIKQEIISDLVNEKFSEGNITKYANEIQFNSPYARICNNFYYGREIVEAVLNDPEVKKSRQNDKSVPEKEQEQEEEYQR